MQLPIWGCTWLGDTSKDIRFGGAGDMRSPMREHLEKVNFKPKKEIVRRNQYVKAHQPRGRMSCTHTNPLRAVATMFGLTVDDDDFKDLSYYQNEKHGFDFNTGNLASLGVLGVAERVEQNFSLPLLYFNVGFNSDDFDYLVANWFCLVIGHEVNEWWREDVMDNVRIDTSNRGERDSGHITLYYNYHVHDSNKWSPYEVYEIPKERRHDLRKYGDVYPSAWVYLPIEQIYEIPKQTSKDLYMMLDRLSYRRDHAHETPFWPQQQRLYSAEQKIIERNLPHDQNSVLHLCHGRLEAMKHSKTMTLDIERNHLHYLAQQIRKYLWLKLVK